MNEKIDKLIDWLRIQTKTIDYKVYYVVKVINAEKLGRKNYEIISKDEFRNQIRKILGIDRQCFQCLDWHFEHDLSVVEGTDHMVCQNCAEGIISGDIKLREI